MRYRVRPLAIALVTALLPALLTTDCTSWGRQHASPRDLLEAKHRNEIRVTLGGGVRADLKAPWIEGDSLLGYADNFVPGLSARRVAEKRAYLVSVPLDSIRQVETLHFSAGKTLLLLVGLGVTAGVIAAIAGDDDSHPSTYTPPPSSGGGSGDGYVPSCPLVWSWDGQEWRLDSGTYAGAIMPALSRTDVDNLEHAREEDGVVRLRLTGLSSETEHVDALSLLVVDHDSTVAIAPDGAGDLHSVAAALAPVQARDFAGRDVLPRVAVADGWCWESALTTRDPAVESNLRDGVELEFPNPANAREARLVLEGTNTPWAAHLMREVVGMHGAATQAWYDAVAADPARAGRIGASLAREAFLRVSIWGPDGWQPQGMAWESGPELVKRQIVRLDLSSAVGEIVRVRLDSAPNLWLVDRVAIDYSPEREFQAREVRPETARDLAGRDIRALLAAEDRTDYVMTPADTAEITFRVPPPRPGQRRTYLARTTGWYRITVPETGEPQTALVDRLETEPGAVSRFAVTRMNQALAAMAARR